MIDFDNTFGVITASCDAEGCTHEEDFDGFDGHCDLQGAIEEMKSSGWRIRHINGDWEHTCPMCAEKQYD